MKKGIQAALLLSLCAVLATVITLLHFGKMPIQWAYDPNPEKCLPDLHLVLLVKSATTKPVAADLVFWSPSGALADIHQEYVLKRVAGTPGDRLKISGNTVSINGAVVVNGFPLADLYHRAPKEFERDEIIPAGKVFMIGTHALSNDSRYWGYLDFNAIKGTGYKIF